MSTDIKAIIKLAAHIAMNGAITADMQDSDDAKAVAFHISSRIMGLSDELPLPDTGNSVSPGGREGGEMPGLFDHQDQAASRVDAGDGGGHLGRSSAGREGGNDSVPPLPADAPVSASSEGGDQAVTPSSDGGDWGSADPLDPNEYGPDVFRLLYRAWPGLSETPVADDALVDIIFRDGSTAESMKAGTYWWLARSYHDDIIAWRPAVPHEGGAETTDEPASHGVSAGLQGRAECGCRTCSPITMDSMRMVVCATCGNKRCPHANNHQNACTGSNEAGQPGSAYP